MRSWRLLLATAMLGVLTLAATACGRSEDPLAQLETIPVTAPAPPQTVPEPPALSPAAPQAPRRQRRERRERRRPLPKVAPSPDRLAPRTAVPPPPDAADQHLPPNCCSESRRGRRVDAIVVHTTESADSRGFGELARLARYFVRVRRSAHVAVDGEGYSSRMVDDARSAYHASYWNVGTLGIEQVGYASFDIDAWAKRPVQLEAAARWIAHWAARHRIPIERCEVAGLRYNRNRRVVAGAIVRRGICTHDQVDPRNRDDPGAGYPLDAVLRRARAVAAAAAD
jgi:hypothetical protein